jgi:hypothetical protein
MATSGSWDFSRTAAQIIQSAYEDLGYLYPGETPTTADVTMALARLNMIAKQWQGRADHFPGLKIWTRQRLTLFPVSGQARYLVGPASTDDRASAAVVVTTLTAAKAATATSVTVGDTTGMTAGDQIGFVTSAGTGAIGWTTISVVSSGTVLTLPANSVAAANANAVVYTYTSKAQRFVDLEAVKLRDWSTPTQPIDIDVDVYTDVGQYEAVPQKLAPGDPLSILVEPQRLNTVVTCNFASTNMYKALWMTVIYPAEDYDSATGADDIAYPQEYYAALSWELAFRLAPSVGQWTQLMQDNRMNAINMAVSLNPDNTSACFEPGRD